MQQNAVLDTALLDRLLYRCEVVKLEGKSFRMENRKRIFENTQKHYSPIKAITIYIYFYCNDRIKAGINKKIGNIYP